MRAVKIILFSFCLTAIQIDIIAQSEQRVVRAIKLSADPSVYDKFKHDGIYRIKGIDHEYHASMLHWALMKGHDEVALSLIQYGLDVNRENKSGEEAIFMYDGKNETVLNALIEAGANVNCINSNWETPLLNGTRTKPPSFFEHLIRAGADVNYVNIKPMGGYDTKQMTPLLSTDRGSVAEMILRWGGDAMYHSLSDGRNIFHTFADEDREDDFQFINKALGHYIATRPERLPKLLLQKAFIPKLQRRYNPIQLTGKNAQMANMYVWAILECWKLTGKNVKDEVMADDFLSKMYQSNPSAWGRLINEPPSMALKPLKPTKADGLGYPVKRIGDEVWITENLRVKRFRNGDPIPQASNMEEWKKACSNKQPAFCYYNFDQANERTYGLLYNNFVIKDKRGIAPDGYHIPAEWEVRVLKNDAKSIYEQNRTAGMQLEGVLKWAERAFRNKSPGANEWNLTAENTSGFGAIPSGWITRIENRNYNERTKKVDITYSWRFSGKNTSAVYWTSTHHGSTGFNDTMGDATMNQYTGASIRCIRN